MAFDTPLLHKLLYWSVWISLGAMVVCFNVDLKSARVHKGPSNSLFGFAVAQHKDQDMKWSSSVENNSWIMVGAPEAQTEQPNTNKSGSVFRCKTVENGCHPIPFDVTGSQTEWNGTRFVATEEKSYQWLGASLSSSDSGVIVACAPRYVYFSRTYDKREPIGACFVAVGTSPRFRKYTPCKTAYSGFDLQGYCQAGLSVALNADGSKLFMGAVGSWYWQGQIFQQNLYDESEIIETPESPSYDDYGYLGYSTAVGEFNGDTQIDVAAGMPRSAALSGKVVLFDDRLNVMFNISGDQAGSYFGYSLLVTDLNGDSLDDIIVGAPMYSNLKSNTFESGRIYVYFQTDDGIRFSRENHVSIAGVGHRSRFGQALSKLGDIDKDGYQDFAVGAPYDGPDHRGAVYIFHGTKSGVMTKPSQIISASDVDGSIHSFGFSLSGGLDVDKNMYPDLTVGAPMTDQVVTFRSRPIIRLGLALEIDPEVINIESPSVPCRLKDGTSVVCLTVNSCVNFTGDNVGDKIELEVTWTLDSYLPHGKRAYFWAEETTFTAERRITLYKGENMCRSPQIYIVPNIRDKLTPVVANVSYRLIDDPHLPPGALVPMLDRFTNSIVLAKAHIRKYCGPDNVCIPDLIIKPKMITEVHVIGSGEPVEFGADITNKGEDAFEARVFIQLPPSMGFTNIFNVDSKTQVTCFTVDDTVICDIGNPLPARAHLDISIRCSPKIMNFTKSSLRFNFHVNSTNPDADASANDNLGAVDIRTKVVANLVFTGISKPDQILFNETLVRREILHELDVGPEVIHLYQLKNRGPSSVSKTKVRILWPSTLNGDHLLYLTEVPQIIKGQGFCTVKDKVNPANVQLSDHSGVYSLPSLDVDNLNGFPRSKRELNSNLPYFMDPVTIRNGGRINDLACNQSWCNLIQCETGFMTNEDSILVQVKSRVWLETMVKYNWDEVILTSKAVALVMAVPYDIPASEYTADEYQVTTTVNSSKLTGTHRSIPLWLIATAVVIGLLLLIFISILLWKCGFFQRRIHPKHHYQAQVRKSTDPIEESAENILKISAKNGNTYVYDFTDGSEI